MRRSRVARPGRAIGLAQRDRTGTPLTAMFETPRRRQRLHCQWPPVDLSDRDDVDQEQPKPAQPRAWAALAWAGRANAGARHQATRRRVGDGVRGWCRGARARRAATGMRPGVGAGGRCCCPDLAGKRRLRAAGTAGWRPGTPSSRLRGDVGAGGQRRVGGRGVIGRGDRVAIGRGRRPRPIGRRSCSWGRRCGRGAVWRRRAGPVQAGVWRPGRADGCNGGQSGLRSGRCWAEVYGGRRRRPWRRLP